MTANQPVSAPPLSRAGRDGPQAAPVCLVHLGLGNFFPAHQAFYTGHTGDWGYAAFAGRGADLAGRLQAQDGLYTLLQRGPQRDNAEIIASVSEAYAGADHASWLACVASPRVAVVTVIVSEAGYCRGADGGLDVSRPDVAADLARLREDISASVRTAPARLVAGLAARRAADGGPLALVPCDNVPGNGAPAGRVVTDRARLVDAALVDWPEPSLAVVSTVVDRITPRSGSGEIEAVARTTGRSNHAPVVTEPFNEWVLASDFPAGRPRWDDAGAIFTDDVTGYEHRKLWLLNGAHSLLAYAESLLGHHSVAEAIGDERCRGWVQLWWATAVPHLDQPPGEIATYEDALVERFANARMHDELARIAEDGSQKLPIRVLPVLRAERAAGRLPAAATRIVAAWICHLRCLGGAVHDVRADELVPLVAGPLDQAARKVLDALDPDLGTDTDTAVVSAVVEQCHELAGTQ